MRAVMAELFATTLDVYLTTGELLEDAADLETADGRPATVAAAPRPARSSCIGCDSEEFTQEDAATAAEGIAAAQRRHIRRALDAVLDSHDFSPNRVFLSGVGSFLARQIVQSCPQLADAETVSLLEIFGPGIAEAACAFAVARLAVERAERNGSGSL